MRFIAVFGALALLVACWQLSLMPSPDVTSIVPITVYSVVVAGAPVATWYLVSRLRSHR